MKQMFYFPMNNWKKTTRYVMIIKWFRLAYHIRSTAGWKKAKPEVNLSDEKTMQILNKPFLEFNTNTKWIRIYPRGTKVGFESKLLTIVLDPGIDVGASSQLKPILGKGSLIPQKFGIPWESMCHLFYNLLQLTICKLQSWLYL